MPVPTHAVVIGASLAGMATARVLRDHFDRVTLVERDVLPDDASFRAGVAQGRQPHILLRRGQDIFEDLFPGLTDELLAAGGVDLVWGRDLRWIHFGGLKRRNGSSFSSLFASRLLTEQRVRRRLHDDPAVSFRDGATVRGLELDASSERVIGVRLATKSGASETLAADFVVDASGRDSRAPEWLEEHRFPGPVEVRVNARLGYASRFYRAPSQPLGAWKALVVHPTPPTQNRIGAIIPLEGDRWHVLMGGVGVDQPPTDEASFLEFAREFPTSDLYDAVRLCEPLTPIYGFRRTENRLRRYENLPRYIERFVALGDSVCAFNPVYGQGMSTAAMGAQLLGECLRSGVDRELPRRFHRKLARILITPWFLATSEDFRYPHTEGDRFPGPMRMVQGFLDRVIALSTEDETAYDAFLSVMHMKRLPTAILSPRIVAGALLGRMANEKEARASWPAPEPRAASTAASAE